MVKVLVAGPRAALALGCVVLLTGACSGDDGGKRASEEDGGAAGAPSAGTAGDDTLAGRGGAGGNSAGSAGTVGLAGSSGTGGGAGTSGSGGGTSESGCAGVFGTPVFEFSGSLEAIPQSLSITGDDLELFYEEYRIETNHIFVRKRATRNERFGPATELSPELISFCPDPTTAPSVDVSNDGLRLYLTCIPDSLDGTPVPAGPLRMAERASRSAEFALLPDPIGLAWTSISVSPDELSLLTSDLSSLESTVTFIARRATRSEPFGTPERLNSIDGDFWHPEFALDSQHVFGAVQPNGIGHLVAITRGDGLDSFSRPKTEGLPVAPVVAAPTTNSLLTPTLSADCRSIYYLQLKHTDASDYSFDVYSARR
jgi:hypothetical protein